MTLEIINNFLPFNDSILTAGQPTEEQLEAAARAGVEVVINLALTTSDHALPDEGSIVQSLGMDYVHIPVIWEKPARSDLERFMDEMDTRNGQRILVHCALNYRVSCFVALWQYSRGDWDAEACYDWMHQIWDPDEYPAWQAFIAESLSL